MEDAGFIIGSYVITFGAIAIYAFAVLRRARRTNAGPHPRRFRAERSRVRRSGG